MMKANKMMSMWKRVIAAGLLVVSVVGCGSGGPPAVSVEPPPATDALKAMLEGAAASGQLGSGMVDVESQIQQLKTSGHAKADELATDFAELQKLDGKGAAFVKKAQEMAGKL